MLRQILIDLLVLPVAIAPKTYVFYAYSIFFFVEKFTGLIENDFHAGDSDFIATFAVGFGYGFGRLNFFLWIMLFHISRNGRWQLGNEHTYFGFSYLALRIKFDGPMISI